MKRCLVMATLFAILTTSVYAADVTFTYRIPEAKVATALGGFLKIYPNSETIADPGWVDPEDGSEAPQIPKYTNKSWIVEKIRRIIVKDIRRGNQMLANENAQVAEDNEIVTAE